MWARAGVSSLARFCRHGRTDGFDGTGGSRAGDPASGGGAAKTDHAMTTGMDGCEEKAQGNVWGEDVTAILPKNDEQGSRRRRRCAHDGGSANLLGLPSERERLVSARSSSFIFSFFFLRSTLYNIDAHTHVCAYTYDVYGRLD